MKMQSSDDENVHGGIVIENVVWHHENVNTLSHSLGLFAVGLFAAE